MKATVKKPKKIIVELELFPSEVIEINEYYDALMEADGDADDEERTITERLSISIHKALTSTTGVGNS